jgi:hypothetical protein
MPSIQEVPQSHVKNQASQKQREEKWVAFEILGLEGIDSQDPRMEDIEAFKDVEITFTEAHAIIQRTKIIGEEG